MRRNTDVSVPPQTLVSGLAVGESPRWHEGRLWFANWGAQEIRAVDVQGKSEVVAKGPTPVGYSIDWLHDGTLVVTGDDRLLRRESNGSFVTHADLGAFGVAWNEVVVDGRGNTYVNNVGFRFGQEEFRPGGIVLVTPDGSARRVADNLAFANGMVVTPDNSTLIVAESFTHTLTAFDIAADGSLSTRRVWAAVGGDGICLDAEGAVWCSDVASGQPVVVRVAEGGQVLQRIDLEVACFACMLGGEAGNTLFMMAAEWRGVERMGELFQGRTGRVLTVPTQVPHAGWP